MDTLSLATPEQQTLRQKAVLAHIVHRRHFGLLGAYLQDVAKSGPMDSIDVKMASLALLVWLGGEHVIEVPEVVVRDLAPTFPGREDDPELIKLVRKARVQAALSAIYWDELGEGNDNESVLAHFFPSEDVAEADVAERLCLTALMDHVFADPPFLTDADRDYLRSHDFVQFQEELWDVVSSRMSFAGDFLVNAAGDVLAGKHVLGAECVQHSDVEQELRQIEGKLKEPPPNYEFKTWRAAFADSVAENNVASPKKRSKRKRKRTAKAKAAVVQDEPAAKRPKSNTGKKTNKATRTSASTPTTTTTTTTTATTKTNTRSPRRTRRSARLASETEDEVDEVHIDSTPVNFDAGPQLDTQSQSPLVKDKTPPQDTDMGGMSSESPTNTAVPTPGTMQPLIMRRSPAVKSRSGHAARAKKLQESKKKQAFGFIREQPRPQMGRNNKPVTVRQRTRTSRGDSDDEGDNAPLTPGEVASVEFNELREQFLSDDEDLAAGSPLNRTVFRGARGTPTKTRSVKSATTLRFESGVDDDGMDEEDRAVAAALEKKQQMKQKRKSDKKKAKTTKAGYKQVRKRWSITEERALEEGVKVYGVGQWAKILADTQFIALHLRSNVDLKDKYRNMCAKKLM